MGEDRPRLCTVHSRVLGHVYETSIFGSRVTNMGQGARHVYETGRTRLWDRSRTIVLDDWISTQDPLMGWNWKGGVYKGFRPPRPQVPYRACFQLTFWEYVKFAVGKFGRALASHISTC